MENKINFTDLLVDGLKKAATEFDELRVKMTLGKYEARDLYEEIKKDFKSRLHQAREKLEQFRDREEVLRVVNGIEHLQVQLALGIAESEEIFSEQKKKLSHALAQLEAQLKADPELKSINADLHLQLEKFKMKLELLAMQFKLKTIKTEYNWEKKKAEYFAELEELRASLKQKEMLAKDKFVHFQDEMSQAFSHIKNAFKI